MANAFVLLLVLSAVIGVRNQDLDDGIQFEISYFTSEAIKFLKNSHPCGDCQKDLLSLIHVKYIHQPVKAGHVFGTSVIIQRDECHILNGNDVCIDNRPKRKSISNCEIQYHVASDNQKFIVRKIKCVTISNMDLQVIDVENQSNLKRYMQFLYFMKVHRKQYSMADRLLRFQTFQENMEKASILNQLDLSSGTYGQSPFADLTESEFRRTRLNFVLDQSRMPRTHAKFEAAPAPKAFDWRQHNAVTSVKNQGQCGSCWAFSTTGNIEGQWAIRKGNLISLSEQELLDCDNDDRGCGGGYPATAYKSIMLLGGLETEAAYPYKARMDQCRLNRTDIRAYINGSVSLPKDEGQLAAWLAAHGPISIAINAYAMQFYTGGISHPWNFVCDPRKLDHAVLLVGYGTNGTTPYWIIKNSWGSSWGENGYYLVYRGGGVCGLNRMATSSVIT